MGVKNKLGIRKVADTGYSREDRERRREGAGKSEERVKAREIARKEGVPEP